MEEGEGRDRIEHDGLGYAIDFGAWNRKKKLERRQVFRSPAQGSRSRGTECVACAARVSWNTWNTSSLLDVWVRAYDGL